MQTICTLYSPKKFEFKAPKFSFTAGQKDKGLLWSNLNLQQEHGIK